MFSADLFIRIHLSVLIFRHSISHHGLQCTPPLIGIKFGTPPRLILLPYVTPQYYRFKHSLYFRVGPGNATCCRGGRVTFSPGTRWRRFPPRYLGKFQCPVINVLEVIPAALDEGFVFPCFYLFFPLIYSRQTLLHTITNFGVRDTEDSSLWAAFSWKYMHHLLCPAMSRYVPLCPAVSHELCPTSYVPPRTLTFALCVHVTPKASSLLPLLSKSLGRRSSLLLSPFFSLPFLHNFPRATHAIPPSAFPIKDDFFLKISLSR